DGHFAQSGISCELTTNKGAEIGLRLLPPRAFNCLAREIACFGPLLFPAARALLECRQHLFNGAWISLRFVDQRDIPISGSVARVECQQSLVQEPCFTQLLKTLSGKSTV